MNLAHLDLRLGDAEYLLSRKRSAYDAEQAERHAKYEVERAAALAAGKPKLISPCGTGIVKERTWEERRVEIELAAAQIAYLDRKFRDRDFSPASLSAIEQHYQEQWRYGGPKPPPDPIADRLRWIAKLCAVLAFLFIGCAVALVVSAVVVFFFHEAGLLAVGIYWLIQWRQWGVLKRSLKELRKRGEF